MSKKNKKIEQFSTKDHEAILNNKRAEKSLRNDVVGEYMALGFSKEEAEKMSGVKKN